MAMLTAVLCALALAAAGPGAAQAVSWEPGTVLTPPDNVTSVCMPVFGEFTRRYAVCSKAMLTRSDPDVECCSGFAEFYGPASHRPSRNCWCSEEVWNWWAKSQALHYYDLKTALLVCSRLGFIIGFYDTDGTGGYCNGTAPSPDDIASATNSYGTKERPLRSLSNWLKALESDALVRASVATGVMSAVGLSLMMWPIAIELTWATVEFFGRATRR